MPKMDGLEMIRQIRQTPSLKNVIIIANSASVFRSDEQESLAAGSDAFLPKPIQTDILFEKLQELLNMEWIYEEDSPKTEEPEEIILPPVNVLEYLNKLVSIGDIRELRQQVVQLEQSDGKYKPFATKLKNLIKVFDLNNLDIILKEYLLKGKE
jgi:response regulator RpfG family c-di-GMP phosphodiesterase